MREGVIAVIDDDDLVRNATSTLIRSLGYVTTLYASADEFLGSHDREVACILTDFQMPGLSGLDLGELLKKEGSAIPMILVTAYPAPGVHARADALDMVALLEKPLDADLLAGALARALS